MMMMMMILFVKTAINFNQLLLFFVCLGGLGNAYYNLQYELITIIYNEIIRLYANVSICTAFYIDLK